MTPKRTTTQDRSRSERESIWERVKAHLGRGRVRHGFTLMELLVVLIIVGAVAALLFPAIGQVRAQARAVRCLNNVKQWGVAFWLFGEEHAELFPYEGHFLTPLDRGVNLEAWYNVVPPILSQPALRELYHQNRPPMPGESSLFACPDSLRPPVDVPTLSAPYFMYGFNNRLDPNGPARFRRYHVKEPSSTVELTENSEARHPATSGRHTLARHGRRANLGFVDGHAEAVLSNQFMRTAAEDAAAGEEWARPRTVYWYPYAEAPP